MKRGAVVCLVISLVGACTTPIEHGLDERAANEVTTALERGGIAARKVVDEGASPPAFNVEVPRGDDLRALEILRALDLPRATRGGLRETYAKPSLIPSATEDQARFADAVAGELGRTLEAIDGVVQARVVVVPGTRDPFGLDKGTTVNDPTARASVLLKVRGGVPPLPVGDVQKLVAGGVPGLGADAVAVVFTAAAPEVAAPSLAALGPLRVSPDSKGPLVVAFVLGLAILGVLAALLVLVTRRLGALEARAPQPEPEAPIARTASP